MINRLCILFCFGATMASFVVSELPVRHKAERTYAEEMRRYQELDENLRDHYARNPHLEPLRKARAST